jgi:hypothetical protein
MRHFCDEGSLRTNAFSKARENADQGSLAFAQRLHFETPLEYLCTYSMYGTYDMSELLSFCKFSVPTVFCFVKYTTVFL